MESQTMKTHPDYGKVRRRKMGLGARFLVTALAVTVTPACEGLLEVAPDPHYVDASLNPAQLSETMVGALVDLNFAYDVWMYETNMFSGGMVALGLLRYTQSLRQQDRGGGQAGGLTGGGRDRRGPGVAYYAFLQQAIASSHAAQERILAGEFETISNPSSSAEFARVSVYNGFELVWLSDFYCEFVLYGEGPAHSSRRGYEMAAEQFQAALAASGAEEDIRLAATAGLARVTRLLGNDAQAVQYASQVPADFEFHATYSTNTFEQTNRIWFRTWGFGEHSVAPGFLDLTIDDTGMPDPRTATVHNPVPPRGDFFDVYAPMKVPSGSSPLIITSGVEMQYILAEAALGMMQYDRAVEIINEVRAMRGVDVEWTPMDMMSAAEIAAKLVDERRRTMLFEGTLMGDTRMYRDRFGLDLFHTEVPQGIEVGTETCRALPQREIDNIPGLQVTGG